VIAGTTGAPFCQLDGAGNGPSYYWDPSCNNYTGLGYGAWTPGHRRATSAWKSAWSTPPSAPKSPSSKRSTPFWHWSIAILRQAVGRSSQERIRACLSKHQGRRPQGDEKTASWRAWKAKNVPTEATFDRALVRSAGGPTAAASALDKTQVELDERGFIKVDKQRRTRDPRILAIGDVAGDPGLAHKATAEARVPSRHWRASRPSGRRGPFPPWSSPTRIAWCGA